MRKKTAIHRHRAIPALSRDCGYTGPVAWPENPVAHGNICRHDACSCGARRRTNFNAGRCERGPWREISDAR